MDYKLDYKLDYEMDYKLDYEMDYKLDYKLDYKFDYTRRKPQDCKCVIMRFTTLFVAAKLTLRQRLQISWDLFLQSEPDKQQTISLHALAFMATYYVR